MLKEATMNWSDEQSDWLVAARDRIDALLTALLAHSADIDYEGVRALRQIPRVKRKFLKVPSIGLAAYHAGQAAVLGEAAARKLRGKTTAHKALDDLRKVIREIPPPVEQAPAP